MNQNTKLIHIFKAGTFTAASGEITSFNEHDLRMMAAAYNPNIMAAPLVLGHPENDQPEMGKVLALFVKNAGLYAQAFASPALEALVRERRYAKVSARFLKPFADNNPTPGAYYLRHVGFLGAMPPAVKGLESPAFADHADGVCFADGGDCSNSFAVQSARADQWAAHER